MKSQERAALRDLPEKELGAQLRECEEKIFKLRFSNAVTPLKNGLELRNLKKFRARLLTWMRENQLKQAGAKKEGASS